MELIKIFYTIVRWIWLIAIIVGATALLLVRANSNAETVYSSTITLQITAPDPETIALYDEYSYRSERDEIVIALNKFLEVALYDEVFLRTEEALNLEAPYDASVDTEIGADFVYVTATASTPELAQEIARTHAHNAIALFGELRTEPLYGSLAYFESEMATTLNDIQDSEQALVDFQAAHGFVDIQDELTIQNQILNQLEILRWTGNSSGSVDTNTNQLGLSDILGSTVDAAELTPMSLDESIELRRQRIVEIARLEPEFYILQQNIANARAKYDLLAQKHTEAQLKASFAGQAFFIQVIGDAYLPTSPDGGSKILIFGVAGSIGFALVLVFLLDYVVDKVKQYRSQRRTAALPRSLVLTDDEIEWMRQAEQNTEDAFELRQVQAVRMYGTGVPLEMILDVAQCDEIMLLQWVDAYERERISDPFAKHVNEMDRLSESKTAR